MLAVPNRTSLDPPSTRESQFQNVQRFRSGQEIDYRRELEFTLRPNSLGEGGTWDDWKGQLLCFQWFGKRPPIDIAKGDNKR